MGSSNKTVKFKNEPIEVVGDSLTVGQKLPSFKLTGLDLSDITPERFSGKTLCISVIPSIDTPVCQTQTAKFNQEAAALGDDIAVLTVSMDLPFAQKRWCAAEGVEAITMASDYKYHQFGQQFGVLLKPLGLLARAVFVADRQGKVTYVDYVDEVGSEPNYDAVLAALKDASR